MKVRRLFERFSRRKPPCHCRTTALGGRVRPRLELLEDRIAPAQNLWIGPSTAVWGTAANWVDPIGSGHHTPISDDYLTFSGNTYGDFTGSTGAFGR